jgi:hypothetical protein
MPALKVLSLEKFILGHGRWSSVTSRLYSHTRFGECMRAPRGLRPQRVLDYDCAATGEIHQLQPLKAAALNKLNKRGRRNGWWKSEVSIVARKPGNAGGVKGHRFEALSGRNMCQAQDWNTA